MKILALYIISNDSPSYKYLKFKLPKMTKIKDKDPF
jgi:hypothetical protein